MLSGEGQLWNVFRRFDHLIFWVHVKTNPGRAGNFVDRPPEGVLLFCVCQVVELV